MTPQASIQLVVCFLYRELHNTALGDSLGLCRSPVQMKANVNPDDKGLSLFWYAIETKAVAGYQLNVRSHVITIR